MIDPHRAVGQVPSPAIPARDGHAGALDLSVTYPRPTDDRGSAAATLSVPAARFRPDQTALTIAITGEGDAVSVAVTGSDGSLRQPNPSEILLLRDNLFRQVETGGLDPMQKAQVYRSLRHLEVIFAQTTPNREAYTGSVLGGYRPNPAEIGLPRGTLNLDPADNVYLKARKAKTFVQPILLYPKDGGPPVVF
jgi:hypothetical protein